jgi:hypothetical protein
MATEATIQLAPDFLLSPVGIMVSYWVSSMAADAEQLRGNLQMKHLGLVLTLCGAAALLPRSANAFDVEGENASLQDGSSHFAGGPTDPLLVPDYTQGNSLSLPLIGKGDSSAAIPQYGNSIPIPGPGVDAPFWTYSSPFFRNRQ